jgi:hypothetical protein
MSETEERGWRDIATAPTTDFDSPILVWNGERVYLAHYDPAVINGEPWGWSIIDAESGMDQMDPQPTHWMPPPPPPR